jgi:hypothetical protein
MELQIFKVEAEGDTMYIRAENLTCARKILKQQVGPIPESMLKWTEVDELPEGEESLQ